MASRWVYSWCIGLDAALAGAAEPALPHGSPELILNLGDPFEHRGLDGRTRRQPAAFLVVDELMEAGTYLAFGPDTLVEARNRCYKPHAACCTGADQE